MEQVSFTHFMELAYELINTSEVNLFNSAVKLILSVLLGCAVGYERKSKGQIAGVGTFALISAGATLAMILSVYIPQEYLGLKNGDPGRLAAQVITGIGFLGAGTIIRMRGSIKGLTTAAGIWFMAMIGMAVGSGLYLLSIIATLLMLMVFTGVTDYEQRINIGWKNKILKVDLTTTEFDIDIIRKILTTHQIKIADTFLYENFKDNTTTISFIILIKSKADMLDLFKQLKSIEHVKSATLDSDFKI